MTAPRQLLMIDLASVALVLAFYVVVALLGARLLRRAGLDVGRGTANLVRPRAMALAGAVNLVLLGAVIARQLVVERRSLTSLGFVLGPRDAVVAAAILAFALSLGAVHARLRGAAHPHGLGRPSARGALVGVGAALLCAALMEEVLFRAYLLDHLRGLGIGPAVVASSAIFVAAHFLTGRATAHAALAWLVGGVWLTAVYLWTGSVLVAAVAHFARNLANVLYVDPSPQLGAAAGPASGWARNGYYAVLAIVSLVLVVRVYP